MTLPETNPTWVSGNMILTVLCRNRVTCEPTFQVNRAIRQMLRAAAHRYVHLPRTGSTLS